MTHREELTLKAVETLNKAKGINYKLEDIKELDDVRNSRNYWIHQCFGGMTSPVVFRKGELRRPEHGKRLRADLSIAIEWDERLANKMREGRETI